MGFLTPTNVPFSDSIITEFTKEMKKIIPKDAIRCLCKSGLPEGNIYDFVANKILLFEKHWKIEQRKREQLKNIALEKQQMEKEECTFGKENFSDFDQNGQSL